MRKSITTILAASFLASMASVAAPAAAEEVSVVVSYADLDLTAPEGAAALDRRIEAAAEKVCVKPDLREIKAMTAWEECKAATVADAKDQLSTTEPFESLALASLF
jgi:UrcA family protein